MCGGGSGGGEGGGGLRPTQQSLIHACSVHVYVYTWYQLKHALLFWEEAWWTLNEFAESLLEGTAFR